MILTLKKTFRSFLHDHAGSLAAEVAYYSIFSLAPFLLLLMTVVGLFLGTEEAQATVFEELEKLLGSESAAMVQSMLRAVSAPDSFSLQFVVAIVALILGASGVLMALHRAFNKIMEVKKVKGPKGFFKSLSKRALSLSLILVIGFLLVISMMLSAMVSALLEELVQWSELPPGVLSGGNFGLSWLVITVLFALLFKYLPDLKLRWKPVFQGAALSAFLFILGQMFLGWFLARQADEAAYGAATAVLLILLWVYYSAQILFLGLEFTKVASRR